MKEVFTRHENAMVTLFLYMRIQRLNSNACAVYLLGLGTHHMRECISLEVPVSRRVVFSRNTGRLARAGCPCPPWLHASLPCTLGLVPMTSLLPWATVPWFSTCNGESRRAYRGGINKISLFQSLILLGRRGAARSQGWGRVWWGFRRGGHWFGYRWDNGRGRHAGRAGGWRRGLGRTVWLGSGT